MRVALQIEGQVDGRALSTESLGGLFSLDGLHPANAAYARKCGHQLANQGFAAGISPIFTERVAKTDPLILR